MNGIPYELKIALSIWCSLIVWFTIGGLCRGILDGFIDTASDRYSTDKETWFLTILGWPITVVYISCGAALMLTEGATRAVRSYFK